MWLAVVTEALREYSITEVMATRSRVAKTALGRKRRFSASALEWCDFITKEASTKLEK